MDRKLKERLIGLVVLLTAAIIILPMILGGPDDGEERIVRLERERQQDELPVTRLDLRDPEQRERQEVDPEPVREVPRVRALDEASGDRRQAVREAEEPRPAAEPEPEPESEPESEPEQREAADREDTVPSGSGWSAQVGSFSERSNAEGLVQQLRDEGFGAFVMQHERGGTTFYRVRVGLEPEREGAQRIAERIRQRTGHEARPVPHP